jgi:hypothetical protein
MKCRRLLPPLLSLYGNSFYVLLFASNCGSTVGLPMSKESIRLSCGGSLIILSMAVLRRAPPRLQQLLQQTPDMNGLVHIDRDYTYFAPLIHYFRTGHVAIDPGISIHGVVAEAAYVEACSPLNSVTS